MGKTTSEASGAARAFQKVVASVGEDQQDARSERLLRKLKREIPSLVRILDSDVHAHPVPLKIADVLHGTFPKKLRDKCRDGLLCVFSVGGTTWLASVYGAPASFALTLDEDGQCLQFWRLDMTNKELLTCLMNK